MEINFSEMFATTGSTLFYGGIAGLALSVMIGLLLIPVFASEKKRVNKKIENEFKND